MVAYELVQNIEPVSTPPLKMAFSQANAMLDNYYNLSDEFIYHKRFKSRSRKYAHFKKIVLRNAND